MTIPESEVTYDLDMWPEDIPVRGNVMASGDDAIDKAQEDMVLDQLASGNPWAWCCIKVTARYTDEHGNVHEGTDFLGGCSYKSRKHFDACELDNMKANAFADLQASYDKAMRFTWTAEITIDPVWVADGLDLTDPAMLHNALMRAWPYAKGCEIGVEIVSSPNPDRIAREMGYKDAAQRKEREES